MLFSYVYCSCKTPKKSRLSMKLNSLWPFHKILHSFEVNHSFCLLTIKPYMYVLNPTINESHTLYLSKPWLSLYLSLHIHFFCT